MGVGVVYLGLLGIFILICSLISFFVFKKKGQLKIGFFVSVFLAMIVLIPLFLIAFESELYFKSDAKEDLQQVNILLKDDFEIISNKIVGMPEYYQTTYLKISEDDKKRIINSIKGSSDFKILKNNDSTLINKISFSGERIERTETRNYLIEKEFIKEYYYKKEGYVPISITISLKTNSDSLILKRIED